jgi:hypothetical protein
VRALLALKTGWTLEEIDRLSMEDVAELLAVRAVLTRLEASRG